MEDSVVTKEIFSSSKPIKKGRFDNDMPMSRREKKLAALAVVTWAAYIFATIINHVH
jgi:hypothetical protein